MRTKCKTFFSEEGYVAYAMFDIMYIPGFLDWVKRSDIEIVQLSII